MSTISLQAFCYLKIDNKDDEVKHIFDVFPKVQTILNYDVFKACIMTTPQLKKPNI